MNLNMLRIVQHLLRGALRLGVDVQRAEMRIKLLQRLPLGLRIARIDQNGREDVERHEDEVDLGTNVGDRNGPHLSDDDGSERGSRGGETETLGAAVGGEDFG